VRIIYDGGQRKKSARQIKKKAESNYMGRRSEGAEIQPGQEWQGREEEKGEEKGGCQNELLEKGGELEEKGKGGGERDVRPRFLGAPKRRNGDTKTRKREGRNGIVRFD